MKPVRLFAFIVCCVLGVSSLMGQVLLDEQFVYGTRDTSNLLGVTTNWVRHSGTQGPAYLANGLSYPGYLGSGVGGAVWFTNGASGVNDGDVHRKLADSITTNAPVYVSFMLKLDSARTTFDYAFHIGPYTIGTTFRARTFFKKSGSGFVVGFAKSASTPTDSSNVELEFGKTYLVLIKWLFDTSVSDTVYLYVYDGGLPGMNTPVVSIGPVITGSDLSNIGTVAIRQGSNTPTGVIDGIRVAKSLKDLFSFVVSSSSPDENQSNVPLQSPLSFTFSAPLDTSRKYGERRLPVGFIASDPQDSLQLDSLRLSTDLRTITFYLTHTPNTDFSFILTAARSAYGDSLAAPFALNYTTAATSGQRSVSGTVTTPWGMIFTPVVALLDRPVFSPGEVTIRRAAVVGSNGTYSITGVRDGVYWPTSAIDLVQDGDIAVRNFMDPIGFYDPNNDGVPDSIVVSGNDLTGIDIVYHDLVPATARELLARANFAAAQFAGDQQLKVIGAPEVDSTGKSLVWAYVYYSPTLRKGTWAFATTVFTVADTGSTGPDRERVTPGDVALRLMKRVPQQYRQLFVRQMESITAMESPQATAQELPIERMLTIPSNFIDSDSALTIAERNRGAAFRAQYPRTHIEVLGGNFSWAYPQDTTKIFWLVHYVATVQDTITVESYVFVDMTTGAVLASGITDVAREQLPVPLRYALEQNYPNPFNPETLISFELPQREFVSLKVYNILGQEVASLVAAELSVGRHTVKWDGRDFSGRAVASGLYLYRITAGSFSQTRKMILLR